MLLSDSVCRFLQFNPESSVGELLGVFRGLTEDRGIEGCATVNTRIKEGGQKSRER